MFFLNFLTSLQINLTHGKQHFTLLENVLEQFQIDLLGLINERGPLLVKVEPIIQLMYFHLKKKENNSFIDVMVFKKINVGLLD